MNPDEPASLDGRYFGPIPLAAIAGLAEPLWTSTEDRSGGVDASPMPVSGRDGRTPTTLRPVRECRLAFHVLHVRGEHGPHDAHYRLRPDGRSEDHTCADLAPVWRRTVGVLGVRPASTAGFPTRRGMPSMARGSRRAMPPSGSAPPACRALLDPSRQRRSPLLQQRLSGRSD